MENTRSPDTGGHGKKTCEPCDDCYNLVKEATDEHRQNLDDLDKLLKQIEENPEPVGDDFEYKLKTLQVLPTILCVLVQYSTFCSVQYNVDY